MARINEGKYVCDVCKKEFDLYPFAPQTVVVKGINGDNVIPDMCAECQSAVSDFIDTLKK